MGELEDREEVQIPDALAELADEAGDSHIAVRNKWQDPHEDQCSFASVL